MGINGLLRTLSPLLIPEDQVANVGSKPSPVYNIRQFKDKVIAIDASCWLHRACYKCVQPLVKASEEGKIDKYCEATIANYMVSRCEELLKHGGIKKLYLVFDGKRCPLKAVTNKDREQKKQKNLRDAKHFEKIGRKDLALEKYKSCVKIENWMAFSVAKKVKEIWNRQNGSAVECVFSPYEADAQLVKLCVDGLADAVITEDSDVLVYSAACGVSFPIIFKLERDGNNGGSCDVISMDWLLSPNHSKLSNYPKENFSSLRRVLLTPPTSTDDNGKIVSFPGRATLSHLQTFVSREKRLKGSGARMFVQACVFAGCDYSPSQINGIGLTTAFKHVKENAHRKPESRFSFILKSINTDKFIIPSSDEKSIQKPSKEEIVELIREYEVLLSKSECVFYFHRVKDITINMNVPLSSPRDNDSSISITPSTKRFEDESFIGELINKSRENAISNETMRYVSKATVHDQKKRSIIGFFNNPKTKKKKDESLDNAQLYGSDEIFTRMQSQSQYFSSKPSISSISVLSTSQGSDSGNIITPTNSEPNSQVDAIIDLCDSDDDFIEDECQISPSLSAQTSSENLKPIRSSFVHAQNERNKFASSRRNFKSAKASSKVKSKSGCLGNPIRTKVRTARLTDFWKKG
jgi:5'-3' exonuclease